MPDSERETRKRLIDTALKACGWPPVRSFDGLPAHGCKVIAEYPTQNGPADSVLFDDGQPVAVVEAKRLGLGPQNVLQQARRYSRGLADSPFDFNGFHTPSPIRPMAPSSGFRISARQTAGRAR